MSLSEAKEIFDEIVELCDQINDPVLSEAVESLYRDLASVESVYDVIQLVSDLMFYVDEIAWEDEEIQDIKSEIQELYNKLQDEAE